MRIIEGPAEVIVARVRMVQDVERRGDQEHHHDANSSRILEISTTMRRGKVWVTFRLIIQLGVRVGNEMIRKIDVDAVV